MRCFLLLLTALLSACTFEWNGDDPGLPLTGTPPSLGSFTKLNTTPVGRAALTFGVDDAPFAAFCEFWSMGSGNNGRNCKRMHLVRLGAPGDPPVDEIFSADSFGVHQRMLYIVKEDPDAKQRTVTLHRPGSASASDVDFVLPGGNASFVINDGGGADVFVYWVQSEDTNEWSIHRYDGAYARHLTIPATITPTGQHNDGLNLALDAAGDTLVVREPDGRTTAHSTLDETSTSLGSRPPDFFFDEDRHAIVSIGMDGLHSVPLDGSGETLLTSLAVEPTSLARVDDQLYYYAVLGLWQVPLDGSTAAHLVKSGALRARAVSPDGQVAYSYDALNTYTGGSGDGWIGDWKFMERGRAVRFSADGARLHFLEHSATLGTVGDLTLARDAKVANQTLAINVHAYDELPDGRLVAIENAIQTGTWNRMVLIDEQVGERRWLIPSAAEFFMLPNKQEMIVDTVSGASGYDILRVPAPL